jgi:YD repeat-containing protein
MENILIRVTSDGAGIQPGIDALEQLELKDKELAASVKQTTVEIQKRDKAISDGSKTAKKDVDGLASSFGNLSKSLVGGTYNKNLEELQKNLRGTKDEFKQLALVIDVSKQKLAQLKPNSAEWKELTEQIAAGEEILKMFGEEANKTVVKTKSLRAELRGLKEEIALRQVAGETSEDLDKLIQKAGELDDALKDVNQAVSQTGSDTRNIEGLVQILGTGVQAIAGMQAAQSLLGEENEEFNKVLAKMNALLVLSNSIQAIQQAILKESAAVTLITNAQKKVSILLTQLQTATESNYTVVRYAAVAAQKILNAVMAASPAGLLLVAIGALAGAVLYFTSNTNKAADAQKRLNDEMESAIEMNDRYNEGIETSNEITLERMKLAGASAKEIRDQQIKFLQDEVNRNTALEDSQREAYDKAYEFKRNAALKGGKIDADQLEQADRTIKAFNEISKKRIDSLNKLNLEEVKSKVATKEEIEKANEAALQKQQQADEKAKAQSEKRIAEISALRERDRKAANELAKLELEDQKRLRDAVIDSDTTAPGAKLSALQQSLNISRQLLEQQRNFELANDTLTGNERTFIIQKYLSDIEKLEQENSNKRVTILKESAEKEKQAVADAMAKRKAEIEKNRGGKLDNLDAQLLENNSILQSIRTTEDEKVKIRQENIGITAAIARQEMIMLAELYDAGIITYEQFQREKIKSAQNSINTINQLEDENTEVINNRLRARLEFEGTIKQKAIEGVDKVGEFILSRNLDRISEEEKQNKELLDRKLINEAEYNSREEQLEKRKAAEQQKKALFDIAIDLAKGLFQIQTQAAILSSNPATVALASMAYTQMGILVGESLLATSLVLAKKYKEGGEIEGKGTGTSDSNLIWASRGEYITKASQTAKHKDALEAINNDRFQQYLAMKELPGILAKFSTPSLPESALLSQLRHSKQSMDYDKLGRVIGQTLADNPRVSVHIDQDGIVTMIHEGINRTEYKNKKLLM